LSLKVDFFAFLRRPNRFSSVDVVAVDVRRASGRCRVLGDVKAPTEPRLVNHRAVRRRVAVRSMAGGGGVLVAERNNECLASNDDETARNPTL
jgi:hypothetical protein